MPCGIYAEQRRHEYLADRQDHTRSPMFTRLQPGQLAPALARTAGSVARFAFRMAFRNPGENSPYLGLPESLPRGAIKKGREHRSAENERQIAVPGAFRDKLPASHGA